MQSLLQQSPLALQGACPEARAFAATHATFAAAWRACEMPEWLFWYVARLSKPGTEARRRVVAVACRISRLAIDDERLDAIEAWAAGGDDYAGDYAFIGFAGQVVFLLVNLMRWPPLSAAHGANALLETLAERDGDLRAEALALLREAYPEPPRRA